MGEALGEGDEREDAEDGALGDDRGGLRGLVLIVSGAVGPKRWNERSVAGKLGGSASTAQRALRGVRGQNACAPGRDHAQGEGDRPAAELTRRRAWTCGRDLRGTDAHGCCACCFGAAAGCADRTTEDRKRHGQPQKHRDDSRDPPARDFRSVASSRKKTRAQGKRLKTYLFWRERYEPHLRWPRYVRKLDTRVGHDAAPPLRQALHEEDIVRGVHLRRRQPAIRWRQSKSQQPPLPLAELCSRNPPRNLDCCQPTRVRDALKANQRRLRPRVSRTS